jgi:zinc transport system substrate-binding protein
MISVSVEPQRFLLHQIVGDEYDINVLLPPGVNPESFEPSISLFKKLQHSRIYFMTGQLPFEKACRDKFKSNFADLRIVDATPQLSLLADTHCHHDNDHDAHHSHEADPHVWTSVKNLRGMAQQMWREMTRLNPDKSDLFTANYRKLCQRIDALQDSLNNILPPDKEYAFMIWHPSLSYLSHDYGLTQIAVESEGKEVSPLEMRHVIDDARSHHAAVMIVEQEFSPHSALSANADLSLPILQVSLMQGDIFNTLITIAHALRENNYIR